MIAVPSDDVKGALSGASIVIHTDGSCLGNPGPGGWAAVLRRYEGVAVVKEARISGGAPGTTNNRMELTAAIEALGKLKVSEAAPITIVTDSQYLVKGATEWLAGWKAKGWKNSSKKPVENRYLWEALDARLGAFNVSWRWVRGHAGDPENEDVNALAQAAAQRIANGAPG